MAWSVYLLQCSDGSFYCGITTDMARRLAQHNGILKGGAKYTQGRRPVAIAGEVWCDSQGDALRLEHSLKAMPLKARLDFFKNTVRQNAAS